MKYVKKDDIRAIGNEVLVKFVFNYGTWEDVVAPVQMIGFHDLKVSYNGITVRKIGNYHPEIYNYSGLIVQKYAS